MFFKKLIGWNDDGNIPIDVKSIITGIFAPHLRASRI